MTTPLIEALRDYRQADEDGILVLVSRQACDEAAAELERLRLVESECRSDWADTAADEMMARANMQPEKLEVLRYYVAVALRAERARCKAVALGEAKLDFGEGAISQDWRNVFEICASHIASKIDGILK